MILVFQCRIYVSVSDTAPVDLCVCVCVGGGRHIIVFVVANSPKIESELFY